MQLHPTPTSSFVFCVFQSQSQSQGNFKSMEFPCDERNCTCGCGSSAIDASPSEETLSNIPSELSSDVCDSSSKDCPSLTQSRRIQRPNSKAAESCTVKCLTTCIRGGDGSPGEAPLNIRGPIVVFKQGFRTRQYW